MNWIIYVSLSVIKLLIVSGLVLLSLLALPVILIMFVLGMSLSYLRDIEPNLYSNEQRSITYVSLTHLKSIWMLTSTHVVAWIHHTIIARDKTIS